MAKPISFKGDSESLSEHPGINALNALLEDLRSIGMVSDGSCAGIRGSVSARRVGGGLHMGAYGPEAQNGEVFWTSVTAGISALPDEGLRGAEDADIESMLHAAVYEGAPEAACAAVLRHDALHDQLIRGMAPSASAEGGAAEICAALSRTASGRREDGIIVLPAHQGVFVMYAPTVEHLRDLLYMLGQGYIPM